MRKSANFYFYHSLNDFLAASKRGQQVPYDFRGSPAVKDAIEAIGIPHPEVDVILVNEAPVGFLYQLKAGDEVKVYPANFKELWPDNYSIQAGLPVSDKFILDVHVGKLAKALRLLGFDTHYQNNHSDTAIAQLAHEENRIVLTRDIGLLKHRSINRGYWLRSQYLEEQLAEVIAYFRLGPKFKTFSRCLACNGQIVAVPKEEVLDELPPKTRRYFNEFYKCPSCRRVYWKGSHYERMQEFLQKLEQHE